MGPEEAARALGLPLHPSGPRRLLRYLELLSEWNRRVDLVSPAPRDVLWRAHVLDSLLLLAMAEVEGSSRVADVGSGAGLPGLVWACAREDLQVVLVEARRKRVAFLERALEELGLRHVEVVARRAEDLVGDPAYRATFDLVVARAVGPPEEVLQRAGGLLRRDGRLFVPVGPAHAVSPPFREVRRPVPWEPGRERRAAVLSV